MLASLERRSILLTAYGLKHIVQSAMRHVCIVSGLTSERPSKNEIFIWDELFGGNGFGDGQLCGIDVREFREVIIFDGDSIVSVQ